MAITKSAKIEAEIEKVKAKIAEQQARLKERFAETRKRLETAGTAEAILYGKIKSEL